MALVSAYSSLRKRIPSFSHLSLGLALCFCAYTSASNLIYFYGPASWKPRLVCTQPVHEFHELLPNSMVTAQFPIQNTGSDLLKIESVITTCGCMIAQDFPREIKPGQSIKVPVVVNLSGYRGRITKAVILRSNHKFN